MKIWHYTVHQLFVKIVDDRMIRRSMIVNDENEIPVVWLSKNPDWEETVRKSILNTQTGKETEPLSRDELSKQGSTPVRIEVDQEFVNIRSWGANPKEWYVSYEPIPLESCSVFEMWTAQEGWVDIIEG